MHSIPLAYTSVDIHKARNRNHKEQSNAHLKINVQKNLNHGDGSLLAAYHVLYKSIIQMFSAVFNGTQVM